MIIQFAAVPYSSESQLLGTACATALLTANYLPTTGLAKNIIATRALISVEKGNARYKMNGSAPATACGHIFADGNYLILDDVAQMKNFQIFNEGATASSYVHVTYFMG